MIWIEKISRYFDAKGDPETVSLSHDTPDSTQMNKEIIIDNEKQKALRVVGIRSARACVTMPSAAPAH